MRHDNDMPCGLTRRHVPCGAAKTRRDTSCSTDAACHVLWPNEASLRGAADAPVCDEGFEEAQNSDGNPICRSCGDSCAPAPGPDCGGDGDLCCTDASMDLCGPDLVCDGAAGDGGVCVGAPSALCGPFFVSLVRYNGDTVFRLDQPGELSRILAQYFQSGQQHRLAQCAKQSTGGSTSDGGTLRNGAAKRALCAECGGRRQRPCLDEAGNPFCTFTERAAPTGNGVCFFCGSSGRAPCLSVLLLSLQHVCAGCRTRCAGFGITVFCLLFCGSSGRAPCLSALLLSLQHVYAGCRGRALPECVATLYAACIH